MNCLWRGEVGAAGALIGLLATTGACTSAQHMMSDVGDLAPAVLADASVADLVAAGGDDLSLATDMSQPLKLEFAPPISAGMSHVRYASLADFNGDPFADLAVVFDDSTVAAMAGKGDGTFKALLKVASGAQGNSILGMDCDVDGNPDLIAGLIDGTVEVRFGSARGFDAPVTFNSGETNWPLIPVALDPAGPPLLLVGDGMGIYGFSQPAARSFSRTLQVSLGGAPNALAAGDFDGDGNLDVVATVSAAGGIATLLGDGAGHLGAPMTTATGSYPASVGVVDLNGDGRDDVIVAHLGNRMPGTDVTELYLADRRGHMVLGATLPITGGLPDALATGDFDNDGLADVVVDDGDPLHVFRGHGDGTLSAPVGVPSGLGQSFIIAGDVNGDSRLDLVVVGVGADPSVLTLLNTSR